MLTLRVVIPYKFSAFVKDFISDRNLTQAAKLYDDTRSVSSEIEDDISNAEGYCRKDSAE